MVGTKELEIIRDIVKYNILLLLFCFSFLLFFHN